MSDLQIIADRVQIEALRGEFTDAAMMRDYDRLASLFTQDGAVRMPHINAEIVSREAIRAGAERLQGLWDYFVQTTHPGTIQLSGDTAVGRAYISEFGRFRDGSSHVNYGVYHDCYQRTPDGWKFTERVYGVRYHDTTPPAGSAPHADSTSRGDRTRDMNQSNNRRHHAAAAVDRRSMAQRMASDAGPRNRLTPRWRKAMLTIHLVSSVGLLGADCAVSALAVTGWLGADPVTVYPAAHLLGSVLILPFALAALVTGVLLSLLTRWGLFRHWWVVISLVLTVAGTVLAILVLVPSLDAAAATAAAGQVPADRLGIVKDSSAAASVLIVTTVLSVFKPLGRLRLGSTKHRTT